MREGDKGLERKEMRVQKETKVDKLPGEKELATAKKWRRSREYEINVPTGVPWLSGGERAKARDV